MSILSEWQNFFVIVGSAAGGLTGLQFVTMALVAELPPSDKDEDTNSAFATPAIVYFSSVMALACLLVAPWHSVGEVSLLWGIAGSAGCVYCVAGVWRVMMQTAYRPVLEDWISRAVIPLCAYGTLGASAMLARGHFRAAMFMQAFSVLALLLIGIHNAWDNVTYIVQMKREKKHKSSK